MSINKKAYIPSLIFIALFILTLCVIIFLAFRMSWIKEKMISIDSTIVSITQYGDDDHLVMIEYTYQQTTYTVKYNIYYSSMRIGDTITIYIDPINPAKHYAIDIFFYFIFPGIFALIFAGIGLPIFIHTFKMNRRKKRLIENGKKIIGTITHVKTNFNYTMTTGRHRKYRTHIICKVIDDYSLKETEYKSHGFWSSSELDIQSGTTEVEVWIDREDKRIYYVNIDPFLQKTK